VTRSNMEEIVLLGPEGPADIRVVNSYPSKVSAKSLLCGKVCLLFKKSCEPCGRSRTGRTSRRTCR
jgi:phosphoribosyl-dephospho-CoA transferase